MEIWGIPPDGECLFNAFALGQILAAGRDPNGTSSSMWDPKLRHKLRATIEEVATRGETLNGLAINEAIRLATDIPSVTEYVSVMETAGSKVSRSWGGHPRYDVDSALQRKWKWTGGPACGCGRISWQHAACLLIVAGHTLRPLGGAGAGF